MGNVFLLALAAALNPTLLAASTLMMLLANPKRLMRGYLLGAPMTSVTLGLVIVFSLKGSGVIPTTEDTPSPAATMALGAIFLTVAFLIGTGRRQATAARRRERNRDKGPTPVAAALSKRVAADNVRRWGVAHTSGASYLAGLRRIDKLNYSTAQTVLLVLAFNLVILVLLKLPLLGFAIAPG